MIFLSEGRVGYLGGLHPYSTFACFLLQVLFESLGPNLLFRIPVSNVFRKRIRYALLTDHIKAGDGGDTLLA